MFQFYSGKYGSALAGILDPPRSPNLGPGSPNQPIKGKLQHLTLQNAFMPHVVKNHDMAKACLAGLWLYHDFLDESHAISQGLHTPTGNYWHGLMHRREPDYSNSAYWYRRVGDHPIFASLCQSAMECAEALPPSDPAHFLSNQSAWDPFAFIHLCESCCGSGSSTEALCRKIQGTEWELLFDYCFQETIKT